MHHFLSTLSADSALLLELIERAESYKYSPPGPLLQRKILATCFFEPSTRTRLSFESAMLRLGGSVLGFSDKSSSSHKKGESLEDTIRTLSGYCDAIVLRHPEAFAATRAVKTSTVPLINAGDGNNEHPTQTLTDLFSIQENFGSLENLHIACIGDLKHGRTVHSLVYALSAFKVHFFFVAPAELQMPKHVLDQIPKNRYSQHSRIEEVLPKSDVLYVTRVQKERFANSRVPQTPYQITNQLLKKAAKHLKILHPLPRLEEIAREVDSTSFAHYFIQSDNGVFVRQALLTKVLLS